MTSQGAPEGSVGKDFIKVELSQHFYFENVLYLVKHSYYGSLIAQKRENWAILGGYDVIGGPRGLRRENF